MEINPLISYVQRNIKGDEKLYVHPHAQLGFGFMNGYNTTKIGECMDDNIIYGIDYYWNQGSLENDLQSILASRKTYLIFQELWWGWLLIDEGCLSVLRNYGTLTEVMNVHDTPLYYFELDENKDREN
jgi:hypothetical protein